MLKFVINLFTPQKELPEEREPQPLSLEVKASDGFGKALLSYQDYLSETERTAAKKLLLQLAKIGSTSRPPSDWFSRLKWSANKTSESMHQEFISDWWFILEKQLQDSKSFFRHRQSYEQHSLSSSNLAVARGIIWCYIHHQGARRMPNLLHFASSCQEAYPNCPKVHVQLANAIIDMASTQHYFMQWEREIRFSYPNLQYGRVGVKIQRIYK